jgi:phospholipase C
VPRLGRSHALHHIVAVPFENRSFDNLLGRLYEPGAVRSFEGVIGAEAESS